MEGRSHDATARAMATRSWQSGSASLEKPAIVSSSEVLRGRAERRVWSGQAPTAKITFCGLLKDLGCLDGQHDSRTVIAALQLRVSRQKAGGLRPLFRVKATTLLGLSLKLLALGC